jgi:hypothetical protein
MDFFGRQQSACTDGRWSFVQLEHDVASSAPLTFFHYPTRVRGRFAERGVSLDCTAPATRLRYLYNTPNIGVAIPSPAVHGGIPRYHGMETRRSRCPYGH